MDKLPRTMKLEFANADDLFKFSLIITPDEGGKARLEPSRTRNVTSYRDSQDSTRAGHSTLISMSTATTRTNPRRSSVSRRFVCGLIRFIAFEFRFLIIATSQIYHPNIDLEGNVCLNILREDWKPVLNINSIIVGLQYLFLEPNADDPLNKGAFALISRLI